MPSCRVLRKKIISLVMCCLVAITTVFGLIFISKDGNPLATLALYVVLVIAVLVAAVTLDRNACTSTQRDADDAEALPLLRGRRRRMESESSRPLHLGGPAVLKYLSVLGCRRTPSTPRSRRLSFSQRARTQQGNETDSSSGIDSSNESSTTCIRCGSKAVLGADERRSNGFPAQELRPLRGILSPRKCSGDAKKKPLQKAASVCGGVVKEEHDTAPQLRQSSSDNALVSQDAADGPMTGSSNGNAAFIPVRSVTFPPDDQVKCITNQDELRNFRLQSKEQTQFATIYVLCNKCKELPDGDLAS